MRRLVGSLVASLALACSSPSPVRSTSPGPAAVLVTPKPLAKPASPKPAPVAPPPESREEAMVARMLERMGRVRGLTPKKPVPAMVLGRSALISRVKAHVDREVPHDAIIEEGLVQQLLGFIPPRFDYENMTYALLEAQLAGFYEPADGTMYMASDLDDDNAFATLAHELVHALQDQYWDLAPHGKYVPGEDDRTSAFSSMAEGDATSAMADVLVSRIRAGATALDMPDELFVDQVIGNMSGAETANAPHVMQMSLVAPYIDGTLFVHALRRKGGWAAVNRAWESPPQTTEQLLHIEKWQAKEPALSVAEPTYAALGQGWAVAEADTYGEQGVRLWFGEWVGAARSGLLASGWGGDRGVLLKKGDAYAFAWRLRYDDARMKSDSVFATRAFKEISAAVEKLGRTRVHEAGVFSCVERDELGPLAVAQRGRDVVVLAGPATVKPKAWSSAGKCATSRKWAAENASP